MLWLHLCLSTLGGPLSALRMWPSTPDQAHVPPAVH